MRRILHLLPERCNPVTYRSPATVTPGLPAVHAGSLIGSLKVANWFLLAPAPITCGGLERQRIV